MENEDNQIKKPTLSSWEYIKYVAPVTVVILILVGLVILKKKKAASKIKKEKDDENE